MKLKCGKASAGEAGGEIFQVLFEAYPEQEHGPYVLVQRAWLEEDEGVASDFYVETHDESFIGHYATLEAELSRNRLILRLPAPIDEPIQIDFTTSEREYQEIQRVLGIIFRRDLGKETKKNVD
jgi:hypothetical protein